MARFTIVSGKALKVLRFVRKLWVRVALISLLALVASGLAMTIESILPEPLRQRFSPDAVMPVLKILASGMLAVSTFSLNVMVTAHHAAAHITLLTTLPFAEFAAGANTDNELFGPTGNPWDPELSPSGSSGGSASAVASGMVPIAQGTDFGCSLRMPAAFCGIVGLRTTPGLVSNYPLELPWDPGQVLGPMARTAEDAAMMLDAMAGYSKMIPNSVVAPWPSALELVRARDNAKGLRLAYVHDIAAIGVDTELEGICRAAAFGLVGDGAVVEEVDFDLSDARDAYLTLRGEWMVGMQYGRLDNLDDFGANLHCKPRKVQY